MGLVDDLTLDAGRELISESTGRAEPKPRLTLAALTPTMKAYGSATHPRPEIVCPPSH